MYIAVAVIFSKFRHDLDHWPKCADLAFFHRISYDFYDFSIFQGIKIIHLLTIYLIKSKFSVDSLELLALPISAAPRVDSPKEDSLLQCTLHK
jgi:hypothetical protein